MNINKLNLDEGRVKIDGNINGIVIAIKRLVAEICLRRCLNNLGSMDNTLKIQGYVFNFYICGLLIELYMCI